MGGSLPSTLPPSAQLLSGGRRVGVPQGPSEPKGERYRYTHYRMELGELRVRKGK